ncbi:MAG: SH3 domain-containing protein, partial [Chloroflexota bacterium]
VIDTGIVTITNNRFLDKNASVGGGISGANGSTGVINNNCFIGNGVGVNDNNSTLDDVNLNWWGTFDGPSGVGPGNGDAIVGITDPTIYNNFLRFPGFEEFECPAVIPDLYDAVVDETLSVDAVTGVVSNDLGVQRTTVELETPPDFGTLDLRPDGSFDYTAQLGDAVDGFRYSVLETDGARLTGLVCITRSNLQIVAPPQQNATVGTPIVVSPPVQVTESGNPNSTTVVRVDLTASLGTLSVTGGNQGTAGIPPSEECRNLLNDLRTASVPDAPSVLQAPGGIELMQFGSTGSARFTPYFQGTNVMVQGNGTRNLTLEGPINDVNQVLTTLTYTPQAVGVDNVSVIATDGGGGLAVGQIVIVIGGGGSGTVMTGTNDNDAAGPVPPTVPEIVVPLGPSTLFEISQLPNTVIRGSSTTATVTDGDVWVRVVAANGTLTVNPEAIGDPFLLGQNIFNGADVYGLTFSGGVVSDFTAPIVVCLRGRGVFYFRDALAMPRRTVQLLSQFDGVFTCATIPNAGTIVLIANSTDALGSEGTIFVPEPEAAASALLPDGCMVTTDAIINLREGPGMDNEIIRRIPFDVTLTAFEQSGAWYYVDYPGLRGWMSANYVSPNNMC